MTADLTAMERSVADPDDLPVMGFDTHQVAIMVGYLPKGTPRGSHEAKLAAERVRETLIKKGRLAAVLVGTEYRVFMPALIAFMFLADPDDLPVMGFDTHQVAIMVGYLPKGTPRGSRKAKLAAERVRETLIKKGYLAAVLVGTEYKVFTPALIAFMTPERAS